MAVVLLICFGAAYGEEYPVDVSGMKAAVLCSQDGQSIIEYNSAERLEVGGLGRLPLLLAACDKIDGGGPALTDKVTVSREAARVPGPTAFLDAYENAEVSDAPESGGGDMRGGRHICLWARRHTGIHRGLRHGGGRKAE